MNEQIENKINLAIDILKESNLVEDMEPDELLSIANDVGSKDYKKIAKIIAYIRKRVVEHKSRNDSFEYAFPERCFASPVNHAQYKQRRDGSIVKEGDPLPRTTIEIKAKRLENTKLYKSIMVLMNTSLYAVFALDRMLVLNKALEKINDEQLKDHYRIEYMKIFLQETRKPEKAQDLEINVNLQQNNVSIEQISNKLDTIAKSLEDQDAGSIIELIDNKKNS